MHNADEGVYRAQEIAHKNPLEMVSMMKWLKEGKGLNPMYDDILQAMILTCQNDGTPLTSDHISILSNKKPIANVQRN